ncbi:S-methyl-5-thioribose kinase [Nocardia yunnanensis]|uniref:S-methyl-5-thioribose kinase n=1 Tax=Nocardia yunnanensis TaxID=2382165 RepID=A0A386Z5M8_9NOCA|nr:S-methyl-5-thioribose kinase [Nocardia yunnanensis]AYF72886.1 S-methyl-5-thioribose kinase [Nocardia yunnanensis]
MTREYRILEAEDVPGYLRERGYFAGDAFADSDIHVHEVSDGNLNRVFLATHRDGRSLAVKQALPWVRVAGPSWPMSPERATAEARAYRRVTAVAPETVPAVHGYDADNYALTMENLADLRVLRTVLNEGAGFGGASTAVGVFVARLAFATSDFGMSSAERKALLAESVNPELCKITEDLVLAEPYLEHEHNHWHESVADLAAAFRADPALRTEIAELRHTFMSGAQALLHGDLHTGSIMVGERDGREVVKIFDPEFSFVGPVGFDLGLYWGNVIAADARARVLAPDAGHLDEIAHSWQAFDTEFRALWPTRVDTFFDDAYLDRFLRRVWTDALGYAGAEIIRRIVGFAQLSDLETLPDPGPATRRALRIGRELVLRRGTLADPRQVRKAITEIADDSGIGAA